MNNITMIPIEYLRHHPENPRLDLGDLTELADSIRANGILQNLTVVWADPNQLSEEDQKSGYHLMWVVIGNRRLEAAKIAGLKELPCSLREMDHNEQIATMLQENMQRSDLTVYEQAKGIQMMMDLGFDKDQIAERTGFSRTTIERRLAVASLPEEEAKEAVDAGFDLLDLVEISKIENKKEQTRLLTNVPKSNLRQAIATAQMDEIRAREKKRLLPQVQKFAKEMDRQENRWGNNWEHMSALDVKLEPESVVKTPSEKGNYWYYVSWGTIEIYRKVKREKHVKTEAEIALEQKQHEAKELNARMRENRIAFVASWKPTRTQETALKAKLWVYIFDNVSTYDNGAFRIGYHSWDTNRFRQFCGMPKEEGRDKDETIWAEMARRGIPLGRAILAWILCGGVRADERRGYASEYNGNYDKDEDMDRVYDILTDNGYQLTEEEQQWKDGTHALYPQNAPANIDEVAPESEEDEE